MEIVPFLKNEVFSTPKWYEHVDFETYVGEKLGQFVELLDNAKSEDPISDKLTAKREFSKILAQSVSSAIDEYLKGFPHRAFNHIDVALNQEPDLLNAFFPAHIPGDHLPKLYRIRAECEPLISREEIFHLPFQLRHKLKTQRFSISGLPCLYLGGSIYVCWEELGRPDFNGIYISEFSAPATKSFRIVNLSNRPDYIAFMLAKQPELTGKDSFLDVLVSTVILWPLIMACHIKVQHRNGSFKPEYIIPQIVLQWVRQSDAFEGVCYASTHIRQMFDYGPVQWNFVFPSREKHQTGFCPRLAAEFELTEPLSWQVASAVDAAAWRKASEKLAPSWTTQLPQLYHALMKFGPVDGIQCEYRSTVFYEMEYKLSGLPRQTVG
jgi:hypothetical protein